MIDRKNHYEGFTTIESITADKIVGFPDVFSFHVRRGTFVVVDNANVHCNHEIRELRSVRKKRLKGKWIRPLDYVTTDTFFEENLNIKTGSLVHVTGGPFKGAERNICRIKGNCRMIVRLKRMCAVVSTYYSMMLFVID
jgi:hypothetical protein